MLQSHDGREERLLSFIKSRTAEDAKPVPVKTLLSLMDESSFQEDFLISIGHHKADVFSKIIREKRPKTFVEFGGYLGYSALLVASVMQEYASDGHIWSVELDQGCASIASELIALAGLDKMVTVVVNTSTDAIPEMQAQGHFRKVDMLFLDHSEDLYLPDFKHCLEKGVIDTGSTIVADNVVRPGAPEYRSYPTRAQGCAKQRGKGLDNSRQP